MLELLDFQPPVMPRILTQLRVYIGLVWTKSCQRAWWEKCTYQKHRISLRGSCPRISLIYKWTFLGTSGPFHMPHVCSSKFPACHVQCFLLGPMGAGEAGDGALGVKWMVLSAHSWNWQTAFGPFTASTAIPSIYLPPGSNPFSEEDFARCLRLGRALIRKHRLDSAQSEDLLAKWSDGSSSLRVSGSGPKDRRTFAETPGLAGAHAIFLWGEEVKQPVSEWCLKAWTNLWRKKRILLYIVFFSHQAFVVRSTPLLARSCLFLKVV